MSQDGKSAGEGSAENEEKKKKKVNKMNLKEVEVAIKKTEEHMGGLTCRYGQALLARQKELKAG